MSQLTQRRSQVSNFNRNLVWWADRRILWLAKHWLAVVNGFFLIFVGLPFLAPILLANGYMDVANTIYVMYRAVCHQLPSRSYFIAGEQVAFCQRNVAIYVTLLLGGLLFNWVRHQLKPPALRWYVFFLVPIALDAGMAMASEWLQSIPMTMLWAIGLVAMGITSAYYIAETILPGTVISFSPGGLSL
jgi:uncharacterized membrane protein